MKQHPNYIGGEWVKAPAYGPNINPSDLDDVIGEYGLADASQANVAIEAAHRAFPAWAAISPQQRFEWLDKIGGLLVARKQELGALLAREQGKTLANAMFEVERAGYTFKFFAGECVRVQGERVASLRPGIDVTWEPLGVVGVITPWNFPLGIPAWKIAPALAYGNCVVFKPPELVPACGWALAQIVHEVGLPPGVFNLVAGNGRVVGETLTASKLVNGISFTGSVGVGRQIGQATMQIGTKVQLEMGGKNPMVVLDDADLDIAVDAALDAVFYFTGQRCTASSRLCVTDGIHDRFVEALRARMRQVTVGHALDPSTTIGPVVSEEQLAQSQAYLEIGKSEGARLIEDGEVLSRPTKGCFMSPALFIDSDNGMRVNRKEIFGPIAAVIRVRNFEESLQVANDTPFGLASSICTSSQKYASHFRRQSQAGLVMVNLPAAGYEYHVPFGGTKASSHGSREQGRYAQEFFTTVKTSYARPI